MINISALLTLSAFCTNNDIERETSLRSDILKICFKVLILGQALLVSLPPRERGERNDIFLLSLLSLSKFLSYFTIIFHVG